MEEIWKSIPDFPKYEISNLGRVKSLAREITEHSGRTRKQREKLLKGDITFGYNRVALYNKDFKKRVVVHRLVYSAFVGDIDGKFIDHINGDRNDNRLENLRLATIQQNQFNRKAKGYCWDKGSGKFRASIMLNGKNIYLGFFDIAKEARMAYVKGVLKYFEGFHDQKITKEEIKEAMAS